MSADMEMGTRLRTVEFEVHDAKSQISAHEKLCSERYQTIATNQERTEKSIARTHGWLLKMGWALIVDMAAILGKVYL